MLQSRNESTFSNYCRADYANGTHIYYNASYYDPSCACLATFEADPDVAGPGVMASFVAITWITIAISLIPALHELQWCFKEKRNPLLIFVRQGRPENEVVLRARRILDTLCDLQVLTGTAIIIAGFLQLDSMSFYHQNIVLSYWWLTLNSFWAARADYTLEDSQMDSIRLWMRRFVLFVSCTLSAAFQSILAFREMRYWEFLRSGYCFVSHDRSSNIMAWVWVAGTALYALTLLLTLSKRSMEWVRGWSNFQTNTLNESFDAVSAQYKIMAVLWPRKRDQTLYQFIATFAKDLILLFTFGVFTIIMWIAVQFIAIWSYGTGLYVLEVLVYAAFASWDTWNLVDWKASNHNLIVPQGAKANVEGTWGFGQILPLAIMGTIVFQAIDVIREPKND